MDYLATISQDGHTVLIETFNITSINLMQQIALKDKEGIFYFVIISYEDGQKEQTIISHETWEYWNQSRNNK